MPRSTRRSTVDRVMAFRASRKGYILLWGLIILFVGNAVREGYVDITTLHTGLTMFPLVLASGAAVVRGLYTPVKWWYVLDHDGTPIGYLETARIFYLAQLSSYIPGGFWQYLDMGHRASEAGKELGTVGHSLLYLHGMTVASGLFYAAVMAAITLPRYAPVFTAAAAVIVLGALFAERAVETGKTVLARFGMRIEAHPVGRRRLMGLFVVALVNWLFNGLVIYFLVAAFTTIEPAMFIPLSGIMAVSWAAGFLVLIVPGGLGVREGVMVVLLTPLTSSSVAVAVAVLARALTIAVEIGLAALFTRIGGGGADG